MTTDFRALITRMAKELDEYRQLLLDDRTVTHRLSDEARAALADEPAVPDGIERDAARYRWIKAAPRLRIDRMPDSHFWISTETGEKYLVSHSLSAFNTGFSGLPTLDDLVDQAMNMYPIAPADEPTVWRRPKPPSLAEEALTLLDDASTRLDAAHENTIRRALERLQELENNG